MESINDYAFDRAKNDDDFYEIDMTRLFVDMLSSLDFTRMLLWLQVCQAVNNSYLNIGSQDSALWSFRVQYPIITYTSVGK